MEKFTWRRPVIYINKAGKNAFLPCLGLNLLILIILVTLAAATPTQAGDLVFTYGGNSNWFSETTTTHDGVGAYQSGAISHSQSSWMETTVTGPGAISFWWKVSSESCCDPLTFAIDGVSQANIRGEVNWQSKAFAVPAGTHTLRWTYSTDSSVLTGSNTGWMDPIGFQAGSNIDVTPPITTVAPAGGTVATPQTVTLTANESATIYYTTNGNEPTTSSPIYTAPLNISSTTTLKFFAVDTASNYELTKSATYTFDTTPPSTSTSLSAGTYSGGRSVSLYCSDSGMGCATTYYCLGSGCTPTTIYSSAINISGSTDLRYYSTDRGGNSEAVKTSSYTITPDTTPPTTTPGYPSGTYGPRYVYLSCSDGSGSGCANTYYCLGSGCTPGTLYNSSVFIASSTDLRFFSRDNSGNSEGVQTVSYVIDLTPPVTTANPLGGSYESAPLVTLSCGDGTGTGCSRTYYCVGANCNPATLYTGPVPINDSAVLRFYSVDNAQNSETIVTRSYVNPTQPKTITVPGMRSTIQSAIDVAYNGDTVLVSPGTYQENINFRGKNITVTSSAGPDVTIIDGNKAGSVVTFSSGENLSAQLNGFTIRNGANTYQGGGVYIDHASPTILNNRITGNTASWGAGIHVNFASPSIRNNIVTLNTGGSYGGGISIGGAASAQIIDNTISDNKSSYGGGISMWAAGTPLIKGNKIVNNTASDTGGGVYIVNASSSMIVQNLIANNKAATGGAVYGGSSNDTFVNNTLVNNTSTQGESVYIPNAPFVNNIVVSVSGQAAIYRSSSYLTNFSHNIVYSASGNAYANSSPDQGGINGNITADPRLSNPQLGYYGLLAGSPAIDAGDGTAPSLPAMDFGGMARVADGNGDGTAIVDIGAYEFYPAYPVAELQGIPAGFLLANSLTITVGGTDVVSYRYALDGGVFTGGDTPVATPITLGGLANGQHTIVVLGKNALGTEQLLSSASAATWVVNTETTDLTFSSGGTVPWYEQASVTRDGIAFQSGHISNSQSSWLGTTVTGPGAIRFWWKVSSSGGGDSLRVTIDGITKDSIGGELDWQSKAYVIPAGSHTILWSYTTDDYGLYGSNAGWLDQITFEPGSGTDVTAPVTSVAPAPGLYASGPTVSLTCNDGSGSGCSGTFYCLGSGCSPNTPYTGPIAISSTTDLRYYSMDSAGNYESVKTATYTTDTSPPVTSSSPSAGTYSGRRSVSLYCSDSGLGCVATYYCLGSGCTPNIPYSTGITITASTDLRYYSADRGGNNEAVKTSSYTITPDTTPPTTTQSYPSGTYGPSYIYLSCNDGSGSGCASTYYCLGSGCTPATPFTGSINVATSTDLRFYSRDNSGNSETVKTVSYVIDTIPPVTTPSVVSGRYSSAQSVSLSCSDGSGTGCAYTYFCLGNGCTPSTSYSSPISVSYSTDLRFCSRDNAGQYEAIKTASYTITDETAPTTAAFPGGGAFDAAQQVSLLCDDGQGSGCAEISYCLGSDCIPAIAYTRPITIAASTTLRFSALDFGGNIEEINSVAYQINSGSLTTTDMPGGGTYFSSQSVSLFCNDGSSSNCATTFYCLGAGCTPTTAYSGPIDITASTELTFFSRDSAGNNEGIKSTTYNVLSLSSDGAFISAPGRVDMVYDNKRDILYITSGNQVLRYRLATNSYLPPFDFASGALSGLDLSPDGNTLAIADRNLTGIHLVDLRTETIKPNITFPAAFGEGGSFAVAYGNDGALLVTTQYNGSGWVPLRRVDPLTGTFTIINKGTSNPTEVRQDTMLSSSADGSCVGYAESNSSDGPLGIYDVASRKITGVLQISSGTNAFNYEIGANRNCTQLAVPTYLGTFIYDSALTKLGTLGVYAGGQPIGVVYHPTKDIAYFAWAGTSEVRAYAKNFSQLASLDAGYTFQSPGNHAFNQGRVKISRDGSLLFVTVAGGIHCRYIGSSMPVAINQMVSAHAGTPLAITLTSRSSDQAPTYTVVTPPVFGVLQGTAPNLTYTPNSDFAGLDAIVFKINDGKSDSNSAVVTIKVDPQAVVPPVVNPPTVTPPTVDPPAATPLPLRGDLSGDGKMDVIDALRALQIAVGLIVPAGNDMIVGDVAPLGNDAKPAPDGVIDLRDALLILRRVIGVVSW